MLSERVLKLTKRKMLKLFGVVAREALSLFRKLAHIQTHTRTDTDTYTDTHIQDHAGANNLGGTKKKVY